MRIDLKKQKKEYQIHSSVLRGQHGPVYHTRLVHIESGKAVEIFRTANQSRVYDIHRRWRRNYPCKWKVVREDEYE